jgi:tRNA modification GTPase
VETDTIAAISTAPGLGGIGIIKISGPGALAILNRVFEPGQTGRRAPAEIKSHRLYHGYITDPQSGKKLDEVLISTMRAPHSYTREDVVEINSHGGYVILEEILHLVLRQGAHLAAPGEFTRRAFLNGRIDLTRAEAVVDIINAKSRKALTYAINQIEGGLRDKIETIKKALLDLLVRIEAHIDFAEELEEDVLPDNLRAYLSDHVGQPITQLIQQYENNRIFRDGISLLIVGKPNVGKSSLLNRLTQKDRAIVTAIPGTTRDFIEEPFSINGIPVTLVDTAGLRDSSDHIEVQGIKKTHQRIDQADLLLFVVDSSQPIDDDDRAIFEKIKGHNTIIVLNKQDLQTTAAPPIALPQTWGLLPQVAISALKDDHFDILKETIINVFRATEQALTEDDILPNLRHKELLEQALILVEDLSRKQVDEAGSELIAIDLKAILDNLSEILGENIEETPLDRIFSRFCIGK